MDRSQVLNDAMMHYWHDGPHQLSINELCRRTGVSKPSLYRAFGSEDGMLDAVLGHYQATVVAPLIEQLNADAPFCATLESLLHSVTNPQKKPAGCLLAEFRTKRRHLGPITTARLNALTDELLQSYERWFRRAQARGEVDAAISPALATHFIDTQVNTVLLQMMQGADPEMTRGQAQLAFKALLPSDARR